jgi:hypothetical protein
LIDPYRGRVRPKPSSSKGGTQLLRKPSRQSNGTLPNSIKGNYDVDAWWRAGRGEDNPTYVRTDRTRK